MMRHGVVLTGEREEECHIFSQNFFYLPTILASYVFAREMCNNSFCNVDTECIMKTAAWYGGCQPRPSVSEEDDVFPITSLEALCKFTIELGPYHYGLKICKTCKV